MIGGGCSPATNALISIAEYKNVLLVSLLPKYKMCVCYFIDCSLYTIYLSTYAEVNSINFNLFIMSHFLNI